MNTFTSILDRPSNTIEPPKLLPVGTYLWAVKGQPREDKSTKQQTDFVEFTLQLLQVGEDVDQQEFDAALTNASTGEKKALGDITMKNTYYITEAAAYRLTEFLDHCGAGDDTMSPRQRMSMTPGCQVLASIVHKPSQDGKKLFANIGQTAPVPA